MADPKSQVNQFFQKKIGRPLSKTDVTYTTQAHANGFQTTVALPCIGGVSFVGELAGDARLAEAAAAHQVLRHYADEIAAVLAEPKKKASRPQSKRRTKRAASELVDGIVEPQQISTGPKQEINEMCAKISRRSLAKEDVVYNSQKTAGGFQSTLQLTCLPGVYGQSSFTGTVCGTKKDAENSVATIAIETLKADIEIAEQLTKPSEKCQRKCQRR
eukprot:gnl/MRDRNA2_/MRDRNA2_188527_c0_seq1.p1 gnl/MRDRNA2_/MRDRNA2_188527_c0~~gnl/MRDRNA2_/MRDRNA2_188527_c0_seq1.p1  ORF type:complete len:216 (+),score=44.80 gnl/MRDRNA2_/MRDRNA2_188527_c0_seq1:57-704(+)